MNKTSFTIIHPDIPTAVLAFQLNGDMSSCGVQLLSYVYARGLPSEGVGRNKVLFSMYDELSKVLNQSRLYFVNDAQRGNVSHTNLLISESEYKEESRKLSDIVKYNCGHSEKKHLPKRKSCIYPLKTVTIASDRVDNICGSYSYTAKFCKYAGFVSTHATRNEGSGGNIFMAYRSRKPLLVKPKGFATRKSSLPHAPT